MNGILIVDKPQGLTSHDVVDYIRRRFSIKKVGHAGTLDPLATGVLVVLLGRMTKQALRFMNDDKEYDTTLCLGVTTDSGDAWGKVLTRTDEISTSLEDIEKAFDRFRGELTIISYVIYRGKHRLCCNIP